MKIHHKLNTLCDKDERVSYELKRKKHDKDDDNDEKYETTSSLSLASRFVVRVITLCYDERSEIRDVKNVLKRFLFW